MRICWTPSRPMFTGLHSEMRQTAPQFVRFSNPPIPDPRSRIPNHGMRYGKDRTSSVAPWGVGHRLSDGYPGEGGMVGKEGRKEGTSGPLDNKKPRMENHTGREGNETLSYSRSDARADKSIRRKQKRQRARNPRARTKGFTVKRGQRFRREGIRKQSPVSKGYAQADRDSHPRSLPG
jgi:hypothetical protein